MTTSGTSTFEATRNDIIRAAARKIGVLRPGASLGNNVAKDFEFQLNAMVKEWQATGLHVWTVSEATLFPQVEQVTYTAGTDSTDHITSDYSTTTISAEEASGQTVLSVDDTTDMTALDNIGIVVDDGTLHWSTIASKTATTVTINDALDDSAADGNKVFFYTSKIVRPIKVVDARRYDIVSGDETPIKMVSRLDYRALNRKTDPGRISQMFYDPKLVLGEFSIWQVPSLTDGLIKFTWWRPIQDFTIAGDTPDLPQEWINCLVFNLALLMAPEYGTGPVRLQALQAIATQSLDRVSGFDREEESVYFQPDTEE